MTFSLTIDMDNAAFGDSEPERCQELLECLRQVAEKIVQDGSVAGLPIRDTNGNTVGSWKITKS